MNKLENTKQNLISGVISKFVTLALPFAVRSIIIYKLGIEYVGLNSLFSSILQVLSLAELGFGTAVVYSMYKPIAESDTLLICALLNFYRKVYKIIGTIILTIGLALLPLLNRLVSGDIPNSVNLYILYIIYLINTVISYLGVAYKQSLLIAHHKVNIDTNISTVIYSIMYLLQIVALLITRNYYCYIILLPIATLVINFVRNRKVNNIYPHYVCMGTLDADIKKELFKRVAGLMLSRICQVCRNSFDSIAISTFLGLVILGRYQNYYYIMSAVIGFMQIIPTSVVAGIGNNIATKSIEENYEQFEVFYFCYNWLSIWCTVCLLCLYQPFMEMWVGSDNMFPFMLVILMCLYFYSLKVGDVVAIYKEATGIYWEDKFRPVVESVVNLALNFGLVQLIGVYGVVLSTIISIVFINIPWAAKVLFSTYFKKNTAGYLKRVLVGTLELIIISIVSYLLCAVVTWKGVVALIIRAFICMFVPNIIYIILNIKNPRLRESIDIIRRIFEIKIARRM